MEKIEFTPTRDDLLQGQRLNQVVVLKGWVGIALVVGAVFVALVGAVLQYAGGEGRLESGISGFAIALFYLIFFPLLGRYVSLPLAARRQFAQQKELQASLSFQVHSPHITVTSKNGFSNIPTEELRKWAENRKVILLYRSDRLFNFIPKRAITPTFDAELKAELTRAGVRRVGG